MKRLVSTSGLAVLLAGLGLPHLQAQTRQAFGVTGTAQGTTNCWAVVPLAGWPGQPVVRYLNATSDKAGAKATWATATAATSIAATNGVGATNAVVVSTNGFAAGDWVVMVAGAYPNETYSAAKLFAVYQGTNVSSPDLVFAPGAVLYRMAAAGNIPVGNGTKELNGGALYAGPHHKPLLLTLDSTSTVATINALGGEYR